ncbi:hypothetical protein BpHYR1_054449 [Brachionus plicatilis]|uniref:Uncharacterized protein n=1 Tax=Brachionus plicatilis TaxID=10195 RepID=A0A3M7R3C4_BRAPC|nr:hypothetical protein BpHYR1_054449 [Brachionus plicatilis]
MVLQSIMFKRKLKNLVVQSLRNLIDKVHPFKKLNQKKCPSRNRIIINFLRMILIENTIYPNSFFDFIKKKWFYWKIYAKAFKKFSKRTIFLNELGLIFKIDCIY